MDDLTRRPLANAEVLDLLSGRHRLTNEQGQTRINWPSDGRLRLRIREIGYKPIERTLRAGQDASDGTLTLGMSRTAYVISPVRSMSRCHTDADSASQLLSVAVLEQLRQGAEKYEHFRRAYPFEAEIERRSADVAEQTGPMKKVYARREKFASDHWEERYRPGKVVQSANSPRFFVPLLFLSTLADPAFWEHHCFSVWGVESFGDSRVLRLEFSTSSNVRGPDWEGAAFLDSATSILRRVEFRVANLPKGRGPQRIQGYSTYWSPSPYVVMPDTTVAVWWLRRAEREDQWGDPDVAQMVRIEVLKYRKGVPPAAAVRPASPGPTSLPPLPPR